MIKQYSKIAIWEGSELFKPSNYTTSAWSKKMNCDFQIKRFIIFYKHKDNWRTSTGLDSKDFVNLANPGCGPNGSDFPVRLSIKDRDIIKFEMTNDAGVVIEVLIKKIIAIG